MNNRLYKIIVFGIFFLKITLAICQSNLYSDARIPISITVFLQALNNNSFSQAEKYLSPFFTIKDVPVEYTTLALQSIFSSFPAKINTSVFIDKKIGKFGLQYTIALVINGKITDVIFELDKDDLIMQCSLFQVANLNVTGKKKTELVNYAEIDIEISNGAIIIPVELNGEKQKFILDSGAPVLVINSANKDSITTVISIGHGIGGSIKDVGTKKIDRMEWAGGIYYNFDAITMDLSHLEKEVGCFFGGLISKAEIEPFEIYIDYNAKKLKLYLLKDNGTPILKTMLPKPIGKIKFSLNGHLAVIDAKIGKNKFHFGLDTGAQTNLLDDEFYSKFENKLTEVQTDTLKGADQNSKEVTTGTVALTKVGKMFFPKMRYVFADINNFNQVYGVNIDGFLGYPFLCQRPVSINYRKKFIFFYK